jgi:hypothetical protein
MPPLRFQLQHFHIGRVVRRDLDVEQLAPPVMRDVEGNRSAVPPEIHRADLSPRADSGELPLKNIHVHLRKSWQKET